MPQLRPIRWPLRALPVVRTAGRFPHDDRDFGHTYRGNHHSLHLYLYPCRIRIAGVELDIQPGDVTLIRRGTCFTYDLPRPGYHYCVQYQPPPRLAGQCVSLPIRTSLGHDRQFVTQRLIVVARLHAESMGNPIAAAAAGAAMQEVLLVMAMLPTRQGRSTAPARAHAAVQRAAEWIEQHLDQPLSVPALARKVGLSQNYLARHFRQRFAMTIPGYLLARRIEQAHYLLTSTDMPVKQVGHSVGMPDAQHFNKQFRRLTGLSPSAARDA